MLDSWSDPGPSKTPFMRTTYLAYVECNCCQQPIPLLCAKRLERLAGPQWWPTDNRPLNFLCPSCKHVCEYKAPSVQQKEIVEMPGQYERHERLAVFYTQIRCGVENCASPAKIHIVMNQRQDGSKLLEDVQLFQRSISEAVPSAAFCQGGHVLTTKVFQCGVPLGPWFLADVCVAENA